MEPARLPAELFRTDSPDRTLQFNRSAETSPDTSPTDTEKGKDKGLGLKDGLTEKTDVIAIANALDAIMSKLGVGETDYISPWEKMRAGDKEGSSLPEHLQSASTLGRNFQNSNSGSETPTLNWNTRQPNANTVRQPTIDTWEREDANSTIRPLDSASLIKPNTVTNMYSRLNPPTSGSHHDDVIGGYEQSAESHLEEIEAVASIERVYGLPKIFINDRLNFLVHLHKILERILSDGRSYPASDSFSRILRYSERKKGKSRSPHDELLYQVLKATVSQRSQKVRANPFNLPILEVGMVLNERLVHMCFTELYSEYRREWFNSMKDVDPPRFHGNYKNHRTFSSSSNDSKSSSGRKRRDSHSILGF